MLVSLRTLAAVSVLSVCGFAAAAQGPGEQVGLASGLIVKLKPAAQEGALQSASQVQARAGRLSRLSLAAGYTSGMPWRHLTGQTALLATPSALTPAVQKKLIDRLMASGQVAWVEPNVREPLAAPASSNFNSNQWWLASGGQGNRGVPDVAGAWGHAIATNASTSALSHATVVGVLDTGIETSHPDLAGTQFLPGHDFVSNPSFSGDKDTDGVGGGWDNNATDPGDSVSAEEAGRYDFLKAGCGTQTEDSWHGTIVAAFVAANGTVLGSDPSKRGARGVNPTARILPVRVAGKCGADLADIVAGMYWAAGLAVPQQIIQQEIDSARAGGYAAPIVPNAGSSTPAKVLNISFGGADACGNAYQEAVNALRAAGVLVVAAAGNEHSAVARPGNCAGVVAVAALNRVGFKSTYSNFGSQVTVSTLGGDPGPNPDEGYIDSGAWGDILGDQALLSLAPTPTAPTPARYAFFAGTSYSAPIVAGVVSLMLDVNPALSVSQLIEGLKVSSRPHVVSNLIAACSNDNPGRCICTTSTCGAGILDAAEAVRYAQSPNTYTRTRVAFDLSTDESTLSRAIADAVKVATQDRSANALVASSTTTSSASNGGGGGGGSLAWVDLAALLGFAALAWRVNSRKQ